MLRWMLAIGSWWAKRRSRHQANLASWRLNTDAQLIASQVPELVGMDEVEGMAYVLDQIASWNETATEERALEFATRLFNSQQAWRDEGMIMPYWGTLWVLRTYQTELGFDVPAVAPRIAA